MSNAEQPNAGGASPQHRSTTFYGRTPSPHYPATVGEVLDPPVRFRDDVIVAVQRFAEQKPWRGTVAERTAKLLVLHTNLCEIYSKQTTLGFEFLDGGDSGGSTYEPTSDAITIRGKASVVTYLHEFAHALGRDEHGAVRWSVNLFRQCFPISFARCLQDRHMLRQGPWGESL